MDNMHLHHHIGEDRYYMEDILHSDINWRNLGIHIHHHTEDILRLGMDMPLHMDLVDSLGKMFGPQQLLWFHFDKDMVEVAVEDTVDMFHLHIFEDMGYMVGWDTPEEGVVVKVVKLILV